MKSVLLMFIITLNLFAGTYTSDAESPGVPFCDAESELIDGGFTPEGEYLVKLMTDTTDCIEGEVLDGGFTLIGRYLVKLITDTTDCSQP